MIINKFVSLKAIIDDVMRDTQMASAPSYEDCAYWSFECLGLIGHPIQFIRKVTGHVANPNLDIVDYRAELPCDLYRLEQIAVNGSAARYSGNTFHHLVGGECCGVDVGNSTTDIFFDNFGNAFSPQSSSVGGGAVNDVVTFDINNNYLTLSEKEGQACIAYLAFPTDEDGFPMIPDDINYRKAVKTYLMSKLAYIAWIKEPSNGGKKAIYDIASKDWHYMAGKTSNASKMPHPEQMESIKNQVIRMIPDINAHSNFFGSLGAQELKKIV